MLPIDCTTLFVRASITSMVVPPLFVTKIRFVAAAKGMAADSSPSRSHTCLRPPQCPLITLQFIGPPFSFFHDELRVAETGPKSRRHSRPELLAPLEAEGFGVPTIRELTVTIHDG